MPLVSPTRVVCLLALLLIATCTRAATYTATNTAGFNSALSSVVLGDTIILNAGTTYVGTFTLPKRDTGTGYITIQSSALSSLPADGTRVTPANVSSMPRIQSNLNNVPAISMALGAHHYKLIGLEMVCNTDPNIAQGNGILHLGEGTSNQNSLSLVPHNLIVDRCVIRPHSILQSVARGIQLHSASTEIKNCHISGIHLSGIESQAILGYNGPGPYLIDNNYLEAAGENIMFGGAPNHITDMNPSNITITRNHFHLPLSWRVTTDTAVAKANWAIKNLFELKHGVNVTLEGNIFENCWHDAGNQMGAALVLKCVRLQDPTNFQGRLWYKTENVIIRKNIIRNVGLGVSLAGSVNPDGSDLQGQPAGVTIENNIFQNINHTDWPGNRGIWFFMGTGSPNVKWDHNTAFHTDNTASIWGSTYSNFIFTNNVYNHAAYGFHGDGQGDGKRTFDFYCPGNTWLKNVNQGGISTNWLPEYHAGWSPTSLQFPSTWSGVLVNQANPGTDYAGWKIATGSAYKNAGTDGKDVGADIDAVVAATAGCVSGVWSGSPPPPPPPGGSTTVTFKNGVNGYNGNVSFAVSGQSPTSNFSQNDYKHAINPLPGTNGYVSRAFYKFNLTGIPANAVISSATLQLKCEYSGGAADGNISIHRVKPVNNAFTVNYATATRNTYNGSSAWTGGANAAGDVANSNNDFVDAADSTIVLPAEGTTGNITFDVKSSVQAWVNGEANNGWLVLPAARTVYLSTAGDLHGATEFPVLTVTYGSSAPPPSTTKTLKNGVNGYTGGSSFHVSGQSPTLNSGGASSYSHISDNRAATNGYMYRAFYKFDVSPAASGIPAGAVIDSARLKVKLELLSATNTYGISCYRVAPVGGFTVNYSTATKNTYNGTNAWTGGQNAGGDVADSNNDFIDTPVANIAIPAVGSLIDFDVTSAVQAWVNGTANNGLIVRPNDGVDYVNVRMSTVSDLHSSAENAILEVTYH